MGTSRAKFYEEAYFSAQQAAELAGDEAFRHEIEALAERTRQRQGMERTPTGWRIAHPERVE